MVRVRVTELDVWLTCPMAWKYSYVEGLSVKPDEEASVNPRLSGSAIHFGVEAGMTTDSPDPLGVALEAAELYLETHSQTGSRFKRGATEAVKGVPHKYWNLHNPIIEDQLEVEYDVAGGVTLVGKPDLWYLEEDGLFIVDFKSTSKDEWKKASQYEVWNFQPRYYAVLITDWLTRQGKVVPPIYTQHVVLSTRGQHAYPTPKLVTPVMLDTARERMLRLAGEIAQAHADEAGMTPFTAGRLGGPCFFCDYAQIDEVVLTGGSAASIIEDNYNRRSK